MRIVQATQASRSTSPTLNDEPLNLELLHDHLINKPVRIWTINTRESTPEVDYTEIESRPPFEHWKHLASQTEISLHGLDREVDRNESEEYWRGKAQLLDEVYWKLVRLKTKAKPSKTLETSKRTMRKTTKMQETDSPISSRLRSRKGPGQAAQAAQLKQHQRSSLDARRRAGIRKSRPG